jgi:RHS repeat-associated protein
MRTARLLLWCLVVAAPVAALAQSGPDNDPAAAQGYVSNYFHHSSVDSINQFNGQLAVPVPIGPTYQVGPSLTFQATLTYSTRVTEPGHPTDESNPNYFPVVGDPAIGIGWTFSAGKVACRALPTSVSAQGPCYIRPDGAQVDFPVQNGTTYTTADATQYKLVHNGTSPNDTYTMYDGDGNRYDFTKRVVGYDDMPGVGNGYARDYGRGRDGYYLTSLQDPFGNILRVTYAADGTNPCPFTCPGFIGSMQCTGTTSASWIPSTFTIQRVGDAGAQQIGAVVTDSTLERIKAIQLKTFAAGASQLSQWDLIYGTTPLSNRTTTVYCSTTQLQTLTEIDLPSDIAGFSGARAKYTFSYMASVGPDQGYLTTMTVPSGAQILYEYGNYHFWRGRQANLPDDPTCQTQLPASHNVYRSALYTHGAGSPQTPTGNPPCLPTLQQSQTSPGVLRRTVSGSGLTTAVTDYTEYSFPQGENGDAEPQSLTVALLPPDVNNVRRAEVTLFSAGNATFDPQQPSEPGDRVGSVMRHAVYESDPNAPVIKASYLAPVCGSADLDTLCATHAIRVTQSLYQYGSTEVNPPSPDGDGNNRRLGSTTTYYGHITATNPRTADYCPSGCLKKASIYTLSSGKTWDGVSPNGNGRHYNVECQSAANTCNPAALNAGERATTTTWTPNDSPPIHLLNIYSSQVQSEGGVTSPGRATAERDLFFNTANGFLDAAATVDSPTSRIVGDCRYPERTAVSPYPPTGNVVDEVTATAVILLNPNPPSVGSNPCYAAPPPPASPIGNWPGTIGTNSDAFGQQQGFSGGLLANRRSINNQTPLSWYSYNVTRDALTGWITFSYDTAALQTAFRYDSLGRTTLVTPPGGEAATTISYSDPTHTTVSRTGADDASWRQFLYDGLGRLIREVRQMPSGYAFRAHTYDAAGHESFVSEWKACTSQTGDCVTGTNSLGTSSTSFDPFDRAQTITKADGATTTISFTDTGILYSDTRKAITLNNVGCTWNGTSCTGGSAATTAYRYDIYGRLTTTLEPSGDITTHTYDVNGKLVTVTQGTQARAFAYDALGFVLTETTPEAGTTDYRIGTPAYSNWGSLGNLLSRKDGSPTITRSYLYDPAGRELCEISGTFGTGQNCDTAGLNLYIRNFYDGDGFAGGTYKLGKLTQRVGYNRILSPTATVTEQFTYSNNAGRLSQETTSTVNGSSSSTATQSWTYDTLGLVKTHNHPRSSGTFTVTNTHTQGYVTGVSAAGQNIVNIASYNPSGGLASWTAGNGSLGNGVVTTIAQDSSLLPRPSEIQTSNATGGSFDSGLYHYDGAGNIVAMGNGDLFGYDTRSRLTSANYSGVGTQTYSYDRYGNLLSDGTTIFCVTTCTNNKLPSPWTYDTRGNLTQNGSEALTYDDLSRQVRDLVPGTSDWRYLYGGAGERAAKVPTGGTTQYTYRDEGNRIVTEYYGSALGRDNVFLGNMLVASFISSSSAGTCVTYPCWEWYASDHLGTPRLVTDGSHVVIDSRKYWPYGAGIPGQQGTLQKLRFAAMERDSEATHYYDHARMHEAVLSRFISPDRAGGNPRSPQNWNRYGYSANNPLRFVDRNGYCSAPANLSPGSVGLCISAFIRSDAFRTFPILAFGDGRTFSGTDDRLSSRLEVKIAIDSKTGAFQVQREAAGASIVYVPLVGVIVHPGTLMVGTTESHKNASGNQAFSLSISALNGFADLPVAPNDPIQLHLNFEVTQDGKVGIEPGSERTGYPSFEIWKYDPGHESDPTRLLTEEEGEENDLRVLVKIPAVEPE